MARRALSVAGLQEQSADAGLAAMGTAGQHEAREVVQEVVQRLDEAAWEVGDDVEAGRASEAHAAAFARARAAAAVDWALDYDLLTAALAVYEAHAAGVPLEDLRADLGRR